MVIFTDENNRVYLKVYEPNEEHIANGFEVDEIPEFEERFGMSCDLYYTIEDGFWHEYVGRPLTEQEELKHLKESQADQDEAIMNLMLGGF